MHGFESASVSLSDPEKRLNGTRSQGALKAHEKLPTETGVEGIEAQDDLD